MGEEMKWKFYLLHLFTCCCVYACKNNMIQSVEKKNKQKLVSDLLFYSIYIKNRKRMDG